MSLFTYIDEILKQSFINEEGICIGQSRNGYDIKAFQFGSGKKKISLIAGNHADEPLGPLLLKKLVNFIASLDTNHHLLKRYSWYIVPHTNPDGELINKRWYSYDNNHTDLPKYLKYCRRELPGDDLEFGYAIKGLFNSLRPENEAVYNFWKSADSSFDLHVSLHGLRSSYGPWFLIDENWINRTKLLQKECANTTHKMNYSLFDLDRGGDKGFKRINQGFCTRPDSKYMREHFLKLGDKKTAQKFHPSSMESIRSLGGDCLTLVSEMPLFIYPKKERTFSWPDTYIESWNKQLETWKEQLLSNEISEERCNQKALETGIYSMPWKDQMILQWQLICSGISCIDKK